MVHLGHAYLFIISIYLLLIYLFIYRYKMMRKKYKGAHIPQT